ncbi:hypothetical protein ACFL1D_02865, partial [Candidatus Omnitrophota bacterium]
MIILVLLILIAGIGLAGYAFVLIEKSHLQDREVAQKEEERTTESENQLKLLKQELEKSSADYNKLQNNLAFFKNQAEDAKAEIDKIRKENQEQAKQIEAQLSTIAGLKEGQEKEKERLEAEKKQQEQAAK